MAALMPHRVLLWLAAALLPAAGLWLAVPEAGSVDSAAPLLLVWLLAVLALAITSVRQVAALDGHRALGSLAASRERAVRAVRGPGKIRPPM